MDLLLTLGIIILVVGVILLVLGAFVPPIAPAASIGWGLVGLGVLLIVIALLVGALDGGAHVHDG